MTEVIPGIHQLQIPIPDNPLGHTNSYLLQGDNEYLIIDPGMDTEESFNALKSGLKEIGVEIESISQVLATHSHGDHYGLADRIKQLSQAKILIHDKDTNAFNPEGLDMEDLMRRMIQWTHSTGTPPTDEMFRPPGGPGSMRRPAYTSPDVILHDGEIIPFGLFNLQVIWTPGHSPGHICLYEPNHKILFSGDHILPLITPSIHLFPQSPVNPLGDFIDSLNKVKKLDINFVLPAHQYIFTNLQSRVEEIIHHHQQRNSEILAAISTEAKTAYQISTEVTWMPESGGVEFLDLDQWGRRMAIAETMAHLEAIRLEGKVEKIQHDSVIYYQLT